MTPLIDHTLLKVKLENAVKMVTYWIFIIIYPIHSVEEESKSSTKVIYHTCWC